MHQNFKRSNFLVFLILFSIFFNFAESNTSSKKQNVASKKNNHQSNIRQSKIVGPYFHWNPNHDWQMDRFLRRQLPQYFLFRNSLTKKIIYVNYEAPHPEELKEKCPSRPEPISLKNNEKLSVCFENHKDGPSAYFLKKYDENLSWRYNFVSRDKLSLADWKAFFKNWTFEI
jgi:hypothetical protein